jgi:hypothetical protein
MSTHLRLQVLQSVRIASPCPMKWEDMRGDDLTRRCDRCDLNVHNIGAMSTEQIEQLAQRRTTERVCITLWKRADGTIMTRDCPVGLAAARARVARALGRIAAAVALAIGVSTLAARADASGRWAEWGWTIRLKRLPPVEWVRTQLRGGGGGCRLSGEWGGPSSPPPTPDAHGNSYGPRFPDLDW